MSRVPPASGNTSTDATPGVADARPAFVLGTGAVGLALAVYLAQAGRHVVAVRTSDPHASTETFTMDLRDGSGTARRAPIEIVPLHALARLDGIVVVTAKAFANTDIADALRVKGAAGPFVILQNGLAVEEPFLAALDGDVYRCVLYLSAQAHSKRDVSFRQITSCPIGIVRGNEATLAACVAALTTPQFKFHAERDIARAIWKKAILNAVFNSICPLLETDNGVFDRDDEVAGLGRQVVRECIALAHTQGVTLTEAEVMEQIMTVSRGSNGGLISTLQDIRAGRPTEIESLNLAMARLAASLTPPVDLARTELLGRLILAKSKLSQSVKSHG